jgi:hypothetical protein
MDEVHLYERLKGAHIARLIKRFQARVRLVYRQIGQSYRHPIVIGVSATLHDEQRFLSKLMDVDPQDKRRYQQLRVIKPKAEELEATQGRERYIFIYPRNLSPTPHTPQYRVNDQTVGIRIVMAAMHNLKTGVEWRGLAFFDSINDLRQFRHNYDADPSFAGRDIPSANQGELWRIRTDRQKQDHNGRPYSVPNHCGSTCEERGRNATLHQCPHFREGDCWLFAKLHGWNERLEVANSVYAGVASQLDGKDLIPTSSSLEVGYDDDGIQLIYQHKAPRVVPPALFSGAGVPGVLPTTPRLSSPCSGLIAAMMPSTSSIQKRFTIQPSTMYRLMRVTSRCNGRTPCWPSLICWLAYGGRTWRELRTKQTSTILPRWESMISSLHPISYKAFLGRMICGEQDKNG